MNDEPKQRDQARQDRLRAALRENLKRRKSQARGRVGEGGLSEESGDGASDRPTTPRSDPGSD